MRPAVTARLETNFVRPVPVGSVLEFQARVDRSLGPQGLHGGHRPPRARRADRGHRLSVVHPGGDRALPGPRAPRGGRPGDRRRGRRAAGGDEPMTDVLITRLDPGVPIPSYEHPGDAGADLVTTVDATLAPGERALLPTGIAIALPDGFAAFVHPRSGLAVRYGVSLVNAPGDRRCRLPGRDQGQRHQPGPRRPRGVPPGRPDRPAGHPGRWSARGSTRSIGSPAPRGALGASVPRAVTPRGSL